MNRGPRRAWLAVVAIAGLSLPSCGPRGDDATADPAPAGPIRLLPSEAYASIGPETRLALILKPPDVVERAFEVRLPERATLHFGYGIPNASLVEETAAATFRVTLDAGDGPQTVLEKRVDPSDPSQRRWFEVAADLSSLPAQPVSIRFALEPEAGSPPLGAFSDPVVTGGDAAPAPHRNVVVISLDTLRARSLGSYGYARDTSPFLDSLAGKGALFENAITTSVTTGPSHMSLFTGLYPVNHGLSTGLEYKAERVPTLAGTLRAAGYQTAAFTENGYVVRTRGFGDGFSEYTENKAILRKGPGEVRRTFGQAERWLARPAVSREPFYLFVHTYQVHSPYKPPEEYAGYFADDGLPGPEDAAVHRHRDRYDQEIRFLDDKLKELVAALDERGLRERTLLVITADHGEEFHEHGYYQHGGSVFEESLRIPMLLLGPGVPAGRHAGQVSLIDVMPTVLDYVEVSARTELDGTSLLPAIRGEQAIPERTLFAEARGKKRWLRPFKGEPWSPPLIAVRTDGEKFVVHRPAEGPREPTLHFDLETDADERNPREVEDEELRRVDALVDAYLHSRLEPGEVPQPDAPDAIDPALREQLEALGYLDAGD